jgi:hypothetical protein
MEEEHYEINEADFAKGFNHGFTIAKYEPDVANIFLTQDVDIRDDFSLGFAEGMKEIEREKQLAKEFSILRNQGNDLDQEREQE